MLKAAATSKPVSIAGAIAGVIRSQNRVEIHAIGAGAVNQAIKAIAISRGYLTPAGLDLVCITLLESTELERLSGLLAHGHLPTDRRLAARPP